MAAAVDQCKKEKKKSRSKELLQPPNGPGVSFLRKELCLLNGVSQKPLQTFKVDRSSILSQVKAFLPRLEEADRELQKRLQGKGEGLDIEEVEEGEPCIEMDLAVVPLPHSDSESDLSDSDDDSSNSENNSSELKDRTLKLKVQTITGTIVEIRTTTSTQHRQNENTAQVLVMDAAKDLLKRAVELDTAQKYSEAMICYEQGVQNLLRQMRDTQSEGARKELRLRAEQYLERAEHLKQLLKEQASPAESVHSLRIAPGATGYSYEAVFERCLDGNVHFVTVQDPYIRVRHQIHNFVRFCELLVKKCKKLSKISLTTTHGESPSESSQVSSLTELQESLRERGVKLEVAYSHTIHDREIRFSNGWIVKLGRGLDYFQKSKSPFTIGFSDFDLRPCHETTIEMYHKLNVKNVKT